MEVRYTKRFLKDLAKIASKQRKVIEKVVFEELVEASTLQSIPQVKKLSQGSFYRIRVGEYRVGLEKLPDHILLRRVLNRKDIYKYFP